MTLKGITTKNAFADQLAKEGYCVVADILDNAMLKKLQQGLSATELSDSPKDNFGEAGAFIVADYHDPIMVELLTWSKALETLAAFGFSDLRLHNFYVSTKPPKATALPWHSDLFYSYEAVAPAELFLIYYLQDTTPDNGCLRVVPGSHLWPAAKRIMPETTGQQANEVDVLVKAGDLFIGDRRILHATHANNGDTWRTCITIAYAPDFAKLPEPIQALIVTNQCLPPKGWWNNKEITATIDPRLQSVLPIYNGSAKPIAIKLDDYAQQD